MVGLKQQKLYAIVNETYVLYVSYHKQSEFNLF